MRKRIRNFLALSCLPWGATLAHSQDVTFPDPHLENAVLQNLNLTSGPVTQAEMLELTNFQAGGQGIVDTTGLQYARNLTVVALNNNSVTNFSGLIGLSNVTELYFNNASLPTISFVTNFPNLKIAVFPVNSITNAAPLAGLTGLQSLTINFNPLSTTPPLGSLTQLTNLDMGDTGMTNGAFVSSMTLLQFLSFSNDPILDDSSIARLTDLNILDLTGTGVTNFSLLSGLTNLQILTIPGNTLGDLAPLAAMYGLTNLNAESDSLTNAAAVANLTNLVSLILRANNLVTMPALNGFSQLQNLDVSYNSLSNVTALDSASLSNLTFLQIGSNPLSDISPLTHLPSLNFFDAGYDQITRLPSFALLTNLQQMNIDNNQINSLAPIATQNVLTYLDAGGNPISDIPSLASLGQLPALATLLLYNLQLTNVSFASGFVNVTDLSFDNNFITDVAPLAGLTNLTALDIGANDLYNFNALTNLVNLTALSVNDNFLTDLSPVTNMTQMNNLQANDNNIYQLSCFTNVILQNLGTLNLHYNLLSSLDPLTNIQSQGTSMDVTLNNLNVTNGSATLGVINLLQNNYGWSISYLPQIQSPTNVVSPMATNISYDGATVFSVSATSSTPPDIYYQWYFDGVPLTDGGNIFGSMSNTLTITNAGTDTIGTYFVVVSDDAGRIFGGAASLNITNLVYLVAPAWLGGNTFQFTVQSATNQAFEVQTSTDLMNWTSIAAFTNFTGTNIFTDPAATPTTQFYRLIGL